MIKKIIILLFVIIFEIKKNVNKYYIINIVFFWLVLYYNVEWVKRINNFLIFDFYLFKIKLFMLKINIY